MSSTVQRALRAEDGFETPRPEPPRPARGVIGATAPIMIVVLVADLINGLAMTVLAAVFAAACLFRRHSQPTRSR
jgi:hypothetical protein